MLESRWLSALISLCGAARTAPTRASDAGRRWRGEETPSPASNGGEGRGEEGRCVKMPLSSVLSPLLRRGERKQKWAKTHCYREQLTVCGNAQVSMKTRKSWREKLADSK